MNLTTLYRCLAADAETLGIVQPFQGVRPRFYIHAFEQLGSTNTQLWQMLRAGAPAGTVVIAQCQTAGRGQWGRQWQSQVGGLYLSLALSPDWPVSDAAQLTCCTAWGIVMALNTLGLPVQIKWPNDLVYQGQKLGGILTEARLEQGQIRQAVIGVGINWHNSVPESGIGLDTILNQRSLPSLYCIEALAAVTLRGIWQGCCFQQRYGQAALIRAYESRLINLGDSVSSEQSLGQIIGVSLSGDLQVRFEADSSAHAAYISHFRPGEIRLGYNNSGLQAVKS